MEFTALELLLGGGFISMVTAIVAHCVAENRYVTRHEFEEFRMDMKKRDARLDEKFNILFQMSRATIQFLPLSELEKAKILNTPPRGET